MVQTELQELQVHQVKMVQTALQVKPVLLEPRVQQEQVEKMVLPVLQV